MALIGRHTVKNASTSSDEYLIWPECYVTVKHLQNNKNLKEILMQSSHIFVANKEIVLRLIETEVIYLDCDYTYLIPASKCDTIEKELTMPHRAEEWLDKHCIRIKDINELK